MNDFDDPYDSQSQKYSQSNQLNNAKNDRQPGLGIFGRGLGLGLSHSLPSSAVVQSASPLQSTFEQSQSQSQSLQHHVRMRKWAGQLAQSAAHTMQDLTSRKYTLPDKTVASQLLMYRQLLHTPCRPGLKLSRDYQGTPAQQAVKHMPWWAQGCETTGKMIISYDHLIRRLWLHAAIFPYDVNCEKTRGMETTNATLTLLSDDNDMPPIPHDHWVHRVGFQQPDPVTDFRSGGVLSLALMLHVVESCPLVMKRYVRPHGDASVLPFAITSINVTDLLAKFLMLAKAVDRMDALLSQKPFWRMFADPNAITACQELAMDLLADVVVELRDSRRRCDNSTTNVVHAQKQTQEELDVTVFDFPTILATTERRIQYDLLGAGPKTVEDLRRVHAQIKQRYARPLSTSSSTSYDPSSAIVLDSMEKTKLSSANHDAATVPRTQPDQNVLQQATVMASSGLNLAGNLFSKMNIGGSMKSVLVSTNSLRSHSTLQRNDDPESPDDQCIDDPISPYIHVRPMPPIASSTPSGTGTSADMTPPPPLPPAHSSNPPATTTTTTITTTTTTSALDEEEWVRPDIDGSIVPNEELTSQFRIEDDPDEE